MRYFLHSMFLSSILFSACQTDKENEQSENTEDSTEQEYVTPDLNGDNSINILVLGPSMSVSGAAGFSPTQISAELHSILEGDSENTAEVNVISEDIYTSTPITIGLGGNGTEYTYTHYRHSLLQYYYWPEGLDSRMDMLLGNAEYDWDYVVIGADPQIVSATPGYHALGVEKVASKIVEGGAQPLLLMLWGPESSGILIGHMEDVTYRIALGSEADISVVPTGSAWSSLSNGQRAPSSDHPTPNGAYLTAASIYAHMTNTSAANSEYQYDTELAEVALDTVLQNMDREELVEQWSVQTPFSRCDVSDDIMTYHHTGSSSENGILGGLNWVFDQAPETLENGNGAIGTFNYGRANSNFEENKRYQVNPELYEYSFGFPMQDHGGNGDQSMLYGLDKRDGGVMNDTDLGVARFMIEQGEVPFARAIPIRTLYAQMQEANPEQSAYRDAWHMHRDLDKAIGAYMYTMLTSQCALGEEPNDGESAEWTTWNAHRIGCNTAWTLMTLQGASHF